MTTANENQMSDRRLAEEEARRRELTPAMEVYTGPPRAKEVVLELYAIGGRGPALVAVSQAIDESPTGRAYLGIHIHFTERGQRAGLAPWPDRLRKWLIPGSQLRFTFFVHSGAMTTIRFMLAEEGFARGVNGSVTIEPSLSNALQLALEATSAAS